MHTIVHMHNWYVFPGASVVASNLRLGGQVLTYRGAVSFTVLAGVQSSGEVVTLAPLAGWR